MKSGNTKTELTIAKRRDTQKNSKTTLEKFVKMKWVIVILVHSLLTNLINVNANTGLVHRRFEYKYSFKPPYLAQKDTSIPFFEYGGSKFI